MVIDIDVGSNAPSGAFVGVDEVSAIYLGSDQVFSLTPSGPTAVSFALHSNGGDASLVTDHVVNVPSGVQEDDLLLAHLTMDRYTATLATPTGWTLVALAQDSSPADALTYIFRRFATGSEPSSYSFTSAAAGASNTAMTCWRGINTDNPINAVSTFGAASVRSTVPLPSITTTVDGCVLIGFVGDDSTGTGDVWTPPSGFTEIYDSQTAGAGVSISAAYLDQDIEGASGAQTFTISTVGSDWPSGVFVALAPSGSNPPPNVTVLSATSGAGGTSFSSSGVSAGDLLVAQLVWWDDPGLTGMDVIPGFTEINKLVAGDGDVAMWIGYRIAGGSEPATYDFAATAQCAGLMKITGAAASPLGTHAISQPSFTYPNFKTPSINTTVNNSVVLSFWGQDSTGGSTMTLGTPTGDNWHLDWFDHNSGTDVMAICCHAVQETAGATPQQTADTSHTYSCLTASVEIKPA